MRAKLFFIAFLIALPLTAQSDSGSADLSNYLGPGVASPTIGELGTASGHSVDLRFYGGVSGAYDTNVQPLVKDAQGNLIHVPNLIGIAYNAGAYGSHSWLHSRLVLSYAGDYREYPNHSTYDGTNQSVSLGYTIQPSKRLVVDMKAQGFVLNQSAGVVADQATAQGASSVIPVFDTRTYSGTGLVSVTYLATARTSFNFGGGGSIVRYQSNLLSQFQSENASAGFMRRITQRHSLGMSCAFFYQTSSTGSFSMRGNTVSAVYAGDLGHSMILNVEAGATFSQIHQLVAVMLDPLIAQELGVGTIIFPTQTNNIFPSGRVELRRQFQHALILGGVSTSVGGGNGLTLTSRTENAHAGVSYTGISKWNIGVDGNYANFSGLGSLKTVSYGGGMGFTYELMRYVHLVARIDATHYQLGGFTGRRTTERATIGLSFTPKDIPLALW